MTRPLKAILALAPRLAHATHRLRAAPVVLLLSGCALTEGLFTTVGPKYQPPVAAVAAWFSPPPRVEPTPVLAPHGGDREALSAWWRQFNDPVLTELQAAAQRESATLAQAVARIARARADAVAANALGNPSLDGTAGVSRSAFSFGGPAVQRNQAQAGVQSAWEIDLFGGAARQRESARAQLEANLAAWHDGRVAVAAEVAQAYLNYRFCQLQVELARADAASRAETARLTGITAGAGLQSPANAALSRAGAADAAAVLQQRQTQCALETKAMAALTGKDETSLLKLLQLAAPAMPQLPRPAGFQVDAVPARVLAQRPDVAAAERDLAVASAGIGVAEAERYPRLSLTGNVTPTRSRLDGSPAISVRTWSIGPSLTLPILDGGRRAANTDAARAQYAAAESNYRGKVRTAVREVEEAMLRISAATERMADINTAATGYRDSLAAVRTRERAGLANLIELEDARRTSMAADAAVVALEHEAVSAWINLYRAIGGGWDGRLDSGTARVQP